MELELGLKITHARDDVTSFTDLQIAKDHAGPLFLSRETETIFILVSYLQGFRRENIDIKINEDGNRITISGKKPVQEMVLMGWIMHKKEVELRAFSKVFQIPEGVILDKIRAKFKDEESTLTIILPKLVKGIRGLGIEEVKEDEVDKGRAEPAGTLADERSAPEVENTEPKMKLVEQIDQSVQKEIEKMEAETTRAAGHELLRKENEDTESIEPRTKEETAQVEEQTDDQGKFKPKEEVADVFQESDSGKSIQQEKTEEPKVVHTILTKKPEPKHQNELEVDTPEKAEPNATATVATYQETEIFKEPKQVRPDKEIEHPGEKRPAPAYQEITKSDEALDLKAQGKTQETSGIKSTHEETLEKHLHAPGTQAVIDQETNKQPEASKQSAKADEHTREAKHSVRAEMSGESEHLEREKNVRERKMGQTPHPVDKLRNDEAQEIKESQGEEETRGVGNEVKGATIDEVAKEHKKQKDFDGAINRKNPVSRRTKLCPPLVVAGSAVLVSIIVLVINWMRAKKR